MSLIINTGYPLLAYSVVGALVILVGYFVKVYYGRRRLVGYANKLPSLKLKFYHVLGHVSLVVYYRIFGWNTHVASPHVYDFQVLQGYNFLFSKENLSNIWQLHLPFVAVYKADSVEMILNHSTELKKAWFYDFLHPWLGTGLLTSHDDQWRRKRKLLTPAFHFNILQDFLPVFNKQSRILVDDVLSRHDEDEYVDIVPLVTRCSLDIICETILGKEFHTQIHPKNPYVKAISELTFVVLERMQSPWVWNDFLFKLTPSGRKFTQNLKVVDDFTMEVISEKKKLKSTRRNSSTVLETEGVERRRKRALLDLLLDEHLENDSITVEEIREEVNTFTFEGHDTTSMSMCWTLYLIGLHPWVQERVHSELDSIFGSEEREVTAEDIRDMKYLECVIKESLRLYPSVPAFGRRIRNDIDFQNRTVPEGSTCLVNAFFLHRDPAVFPDPERFDPDRFLPENSAGRHPFAFVPFSAGHRNCIGQRFALMEEKTVLSSVLRRYQVRSLDPRDKVLLVDELVLRPVGGLRVQVRRRGQDFDPDTRVYYHKT